MTRFSITLITCVSLAASAPIGARALEASRQPGPQESRAGAGGCWHTPRPQTFEEISIVLDNTQARAAQASGAGTASLPAMLALSDGRLKTAYGAGLLMGWGETGRRPAFAVVTAVGASAIIAPFAFLGAEGDQKIADVFSCEAASLADMAERAASYVDQDTLDKIAMKHRNGGRLLVALPGSAARAESVWDLGAIAASRDPKTERYIRNILLAAVDLTTFIDPATFPIKAGVVVNRNRVFRQIGAGEPFLASGATGARAATSYLIHNGVLFPDEGEAFMGKRNQDLGAADQHAGMSLVPAYDLFLSAQSMQSPIHIASIRPQLGLQPQADFDMSYIRALFLDTYRQGRMRQEWRDTFPDLNNARYYGP